MLTGDGENIYAGDGENIYAEIGVDNPAFEGDVGLNAAAEAKAATPAESAELEVVTPPVTAPEVAAPEVTAPEVVTPEILTPEVTPGDAAPGEVTLPPVDVMTALEDAKTDENHNFYANLSSKMSFLSLFFFYLLLLLFLLLPLWLFLLK